MSKTETRSPLKDVPLRYPGQSIDDEIIDIRDQMVYGFAVVISFIACLIIIGLDSLIRINPIPWIIILAITSSLIAIYRWIRGWKNINRLRMARDGEKLVGEQLELLREKGYAIFHDVVANKFNLDHVVVSKHGVFVIETKTFSKPVKGDARIYFDGNELTVNGFKPERNPIVQAKANANWLRDVLKQSTGNVYPVKGVVVFPGWYIEAKTQRSEVWVLNPKGLPTFIGNEPSVITQNDANMISYHLSRYIRSPLSK